MTTNNEQIDFTHWIYRLIAYIIDSIIIGIPVAIIYFRRNFSCSSFL